jgi:uncharacterized tellurite resistance protein B-like protein
VPSFDRLELRFDVALELLLSELGRFALAGLLRALAIEPLADRGIRRGAQLVAPGLCLAMLGAQRGRFLRVLRAQRGKLDAQRFGTRSLDGHRIRDRDQLLLARDPERITRGLIESRPDEPGQVPVAPDHARERAQVTDAAAAIGDDEHAEHLAVAREPELLREARVQIATQLGGCPSREWVRVTGHERAWHPRRQLVRARLRIEVRHARGHVHRQHTVLAMNANVAKCLLVSKVLVADGMMSDDERSFLANMMTKLGLTDGEKKQVIELEGWDEAEPIVSGLSEDERRSIVEMLVDAASADGRLSPHEMATVKKVSAALRL